MGVRASMPKQQQQRQVQPGCSGTHCPSSPTNLPSLHPALRPHALRSKVLQWLHSLQQAEMDADDPTLGYMLQAGARLCKCLKEEFLPYLGIVMPPLLKSATVEPDIKVGGGWGWGWLLRSWRVRCCIMLVHLAWQRARMVTLPQASAGPAPAHPSALSTMTSRPADQRRRRGRRGGRRR